MGSKLKLRRDADKVLCQSVMYLTCDAGAFREDRVELRANCTNTHFIYSKDNARKQQYGQSQKPQCAIVRRPDDERNLCPRLVPNAVFIRCLDTEAVVSWRKVGVVGIAA